jgi:hypothetical protein
VNARPAARDLAAGIAEHRSPTDVRSDMAIVERGAGFANNDRGISDLHAAACGATRRAGPPTRRR